MSVEQKWVEISKWGLANVLDSIDKSIAEGWKKLVHPSELKSGFRNVNGNAYDPHEDPNSATRRGL